MKSVFILQEADGDWALIEGKILKEVSTQQEAVELRVQLLEKVARSEIEEEVREQLTQDVVEAVEYVRRRERLFR